MNIIRPVVIGDGGSFSRASIKQFFGADGTLQASPVDVPAFQYDLGNLAVAPVALLELAATNSVRNNTMQGFAAGTPGTVPTHWLLGTVAGVATAMVGTGTDHGIDYVDIRWFGTAAASGRLSATFEHDAVIAGLAGQTWSVSMYQRLAAGSTVGLTAAQLCIDEIDAGAAIVAAGSYAQAVPTVGVISSQLIQATRVLTAATTASVNGYWAASIGNGAVVDMTLRIGLPQFERSPAASSRIRTTGVAVTRAADVITGTGLVYSNAVEQAPAIYAGGTTYGFGATVSVAGLAGLLSVYRSLQSGNTGNAPGSSPTWWELIGTTYQTYSISSTYALGERVLDLVAHKVRESLVAGNIGQSLSDTTKWSNTKDSATNRWAAFDNVVGTAVQMDGPICMLVVPGPADSLGMANIGATSATIAMIDQSSMTNVYTRTADLTNDESITDYDLYFFEEEELVSELYTDGLPPYYSGVLSIALASLNTTSLGVLKIGNSFDLGTTQAGVKVGFISYTKKETDADTGFVSVEKGPISKRMTLTTMIDNAKFDKVFRVMSALDGIPTICVGLGNQFSSLIQFGFCKEFEQEIYYLTNSLCSFQYEGLT